jgi:uncharacterized membrane protein YqaE (UPF0057 family)
MVVSWFTLSIYEFFYRYHSTLKNKSRASPMDIIKIIFAIILPPLGVFLEVGLTGAFWLNILLTILGFIPGIIHAVWVITKK